MEFRVWGRAHSSVREKESPPVKIPAQAELERATALFGGQDAYMALGPTVNLYSLQRIADANEIAGFGL